jgi:hypothetical protein
MTGQCFQVRGGIIEHVRTWRVGEVIERGDAGWTVAELEHEVPRMFGAGSHRPMRPPAAWQERYQATGASATTEAASPTAKEN